MIDLCGTFTEHFPDLVTKLIWLLLNSMLLCTFPELAMTFMKPCQALQICKTIFIIFYVQV